MTVFVAALSVVLVAMPIGVGVGGKPGEKLAGPGGVPPAPITVVAVAPDGRTALSGSAKGELRRVTLTEALPHEHNGVVVTVGDTVAQRQVLARSSWTGKSMLPHLHFHVRNAKGELIAVSFKDVAGDRGIPRMFKVYRAGAPE